MDYSDTEEDDLDLAVRMLSQGIKEFGARSLWVELKRSNPQEFNQMLFYALEMLKK